MLFYLATQVQSQQISPDKYRMKKLLWMPKNWPDAQMARVTGQDWFGDFELTEEYADAAASPDSMAAVDLFDANALHWNYDLSVFRHVIFYWVDPLMEDPQTVLSRLQNKTKARSCSLIFDGQCQHISLQGLEQQFYSRTLTWFVSTSLFNGTPPPIDYSHPRPHRFECLMGHLSFANQDTRRNKCYVLARLKQSGLIEQSLVNAQYTHALDFGWFESQGLDYVKSQLNGSLGYRSQALEHLEDHDLFAAIGTNTRDADLRYQMIWRDLGGESCHTLFCSLLPRTVYDHSWFTVVTETNDYDVFQLTEKTARPLMAGRPFVLFASPNSLRYLRQFGFQTFGSVIDEGYDQEMDARVRFERAWEQIEYLSECDPQDIYARLQPVLEHNQKIMQQLPQQLLRDLGAWIQKRIS